jgi:hypothetical protein
MTVRKRIRVKKAAELTGKTMARIKIIKGLVVWYYYYSGTNINIKLKIIS